MYKKKKGKKHKHGNKRDTFGLTQLQFHETVNNLLNRKHTKILQIK